MKARAVILAAGSSSRMGSQKLLMPFRGRPLLEYAIEAARAWHPLIVVGREAARVLDGRTETVRNDEPQRGMTYSLKLADARIARDCALIVLLGDKPLISEALIRSVLAAMNGADVAYPVREGKGEPGHPVVFSPRARERIAVLADGDTLRALRDDPALVRVGVPTADPGAFFDVDTARDLE